MQVQLIRKFLYPRISRVQLCRSSLLVLNQDINGRKERLSE